MVNVDLSSRLAGIEASRHSKAKFPVERRGPLSEEEEEPTCCRLMAFTCPSLVRSELCAENRFERNSTWPLIVLFGVDDSIFVSSWDRDILHPFKIVLSVVSDMLKRIRRIADADKPNSSVFITHSLPLDFGPRPTLIIQRHSHGGTPLASAGHDMYSVRRRCSKNVTHSLKPLSAYLSICKKSNSLQGWFPVLENRERLYHVTVSRFMSSDASDNVKRLQLSFTDWQVTVFYWQCVEGGRFSRDYARNELIEPCA